MSNTNKIKNIVFSLGFIFLGGVFSGGAWAEAGCLMGAVCAAGCDLHEPTEARMECFENCRKTCEERINGSNLPDGDPCSEDKNCLSGSCALTQPDLNSQTRQRCCPKGAGKVFIFAEFDTVCRGMPAGAGCLNDAACSSNNCSGGFFKLGACR